MPKVKYFRDLVPSTKAIPAEGRIVSADSLMEQAFNSVTASVDHRGTFYDVISSINITYLARILNNLPDLTHWVSYESTSNRDLMFERRSRKPPFGLQPVVTFCKRCYTIIHCRRNHLVKVVHNSIENSVRVTCDHDSNYENSRSTT
jgi:hypothetical protein